MLTFLAARATVQPLGGLASLPGEIENFAPGVCGCLFRLSTGWSLLSFVCSLWGLLESSFMLVAKSLKDFDNGRNGDREPDGGCVLKWFSQGRVFS